MMKLKSRLVLQFLILILSLSVIYGVYMGITIQKSEMRKVEETLTSNIELTESLIQSHINKVSSGINDLAEAQDKAKAAIKELRYNQGVGYIWINDTSQPYAKMIMHPFSPQLDGKVLDSEGYNVAEGDVPNLFSAFVTVALEKGDGFVKYLWEKPTAEGLTEKQPKLSYVKLIPEWNWIIGSGVYIDDINKKIIVVIMEIILIFFIVSLVGFAGAWIASTATSRKMNRMTSILKDLSMGDGNLTDRIKWKSNDELGEMSTYHNAFMDKLQNIIHKTTLITHQTGEQSENIDNQINSSVVSMNQIDKTTGELSLKIKKLTEVISDNYKTLDTVNTRISMLAERINEQSSAVSESSAAVEEINASLQNVNQISTQRKIGADRMMKITAEGGEKVHSTNELINNIAENTDNMRGMISIVQKIASQTNLLSMNAAIEAAHAGDAGKGFAVVAEEIRLLAESTSKNAKMIATSLRGMLNQIDEAKVVSTASGNAFKDINQEVNQVHTSLEEISNSMTELSHTGNEMVKSMIILRDNTLETNEDAAFLKIETAKAHKNTEDIQEFTESSWEHLEELKQAVVKSMDVVTNLQEANMQNKSAVSSLKLQIAKFKITDTVKK